MREGTVRYSYYKTDGQHVTKGLRNHRRAHWAKVRKAEMILAERLAEEKLAREHNVPQDYGYDEWYGRDGRDNRDDRDSGHSERFGSDRIVQR